VAALAACSAGADDLAWEMLERARIRSDDEDTALLLAVEERLDAGADAARSLLTDEVAPDLLRRRLQERP